MSDLLSMIHNKEAILFDLFHTLTSVERNWGPFTYEILGVDKKAWNDQVLLHSPDRLEGRVTDPTEIVGTMARAIDPDISDEIIARAVKSRSARFRKAVVEILNTTQRALAALKQQGKRIALISNADASEVEGWTDSPIAPLFDEVVFSCQVGSRKPKPEIYEICLRRLELPAEACVFIGDGGSGELEGARKVGLTTVMITGIVKDLWPERIPPARKHADFEIRELGELV